MVALLPLMITKNKYAKMTDLLVTSADDVRKYDSLFNKNFLESLWSKLQKPHLCNANFRLLHILN